MWLVLIMRNVYIITWRLKPDAAIGTQRHCKPLTKVTNKHSTVEDAVFLVLHKLLIYKAILKAIWTYDIHLWGTTSNSNIEILESFQSKVLRLIVIAPWYVPNSVIRKNLRIPTVKEEISRFSSHYDVRISVHPNELISSLTELPTHKRLLR
jgi:hypothetical protein